MNRGELRQLVRDISRTNVQDVADAVLDRYMDEGYFEVVSNRFWPWTYVQVPETVTMIPDVNEYSLTAAVKRIVAIVEVEQRYSLRPVAQSDWVRTQESIRSTSRPIWFSFTNSVLYLWPVPASTDTLDVYYHTHPLWASDDAETPPFDETFHSIIADWALVRLWEQEEDFDKSDTYRSRFELKMQRMGQFYNSEVNERPLIFGGGSSGVSHPSSMPWLQDARLGGAV